MSFEDRRPPVPIPSRPRAGGREASTRSPFPLVEERRALMTAGLEAMPTKSAESAESATERPEAPPLSKIPSSPRESAPGPPPSKLRLSLVVPCYNEEQNVEALVTECFQVLRGMSLPFEMVVVDDGSKDRTLEKLRVERHGR